MRATFCVLRVRSLPLAAFRVGLLVRDAMEAPGGNRGIGDSRLPAGFGACGVLCFACPLASARGFQGVDLLVVMPWKPPVATGGSAIAVCFMFCLEEVCEPG